MSTERPAKRARSAIACLRCKHRKQRCDNGFPACSACVSVSAGENCSYENNVYPADYVESLSTRLADLERQVQVQHDEGQDHHSSNRTLQGATSTESSNQQQLRAPSDEHQTQAPANTNNESNEDEADTAFDMLSSTSTASYLGTSSGFPLARTVQAVISPSSHHHSSPALPYRKETTNVDYTRARKRPRDWAFNAGTPDGPLGFHLIEAYLAKVHPKHLFLQPGRIFRLHEARESMRRAAKPSANKIISARLDHFLLHMIYAIGARYLQLSQDQEQYRSNPEAYHAAAIEDVECLFESRSLESLEGMLLLAIFQLRSPSQPGIWSIIGIVMRHAVSLGLHRKFHASLVADQRRKRIFWTIYMLERSIARTLGRPVCISDRDIDVDLPANVAVDIDDETVMAIALQDGAGATPVSAAIHILRLARIESKIYSSLHRVDRSIDNMPSDKIARLRQRLEEWKEQIPNSVPNANDQEETPNYYVKQSYHVLQYHKAMLLVLLPSLTRLPVTHPDFRLCITSAGQVGQLYKRLHDHQSLLSYSLIALHATFVAGLTLIYGFLADRTVFDLQFSSDIRACSAVLYVISERWAAARKIRDAFERMISNTIEKPPSQDYVARQSANFGASSAIGLGPGSSEYTGHQTVDVLWPELAALIPSSNNSNNTHISASHPPTVNGDPWDIWNTLGPWFGESEDLGLDYEFGSYNSAALKMGPSDGQGL